MVAGVTRDTPQSNQHWAQRLRLPYPLLSDVDASAGRAFGVTRKIGVAGWSIEFFRRTTLIIDFNGMVAAVWGKVKIRGHAAEVLDVAKALSRIRT